MIAGTTIAEIELLYLTAIVVAAIAGELSHMIAMIAAIPEVIFFFSQQSQRSQLRW